RNPCSPPPRSARGRSAAESRARAAPAGRPPLPQPARPAAAGCTRRARGRGSQARLRDDSWLESHIAKKIYEPMSWAFVFVNAEAKAELDALPVDLRASFERIVKLVQAFGLERVQSHISSTSKAASGRCGSAAGIES